MLSRTLAHPGDAPAPHDLWTSWNFDPLLLLGLAVAGAAYWRGRRGPRTGVARWRNSCFLAGLLAAGAALVSPLDALSHSLASAHMVQHVLLLVVAAPLLALSAPYTALVRGTPRAVRRAIARMHKQLRLADLHVRFPERAPAVWLLHVGTLWFWHGSGPYTAALENGLLHRVQHGMFFATAFLFWRLVAGTARRRVSSGSGILMVFTAGLQSVLLSALLTFARDPWYPSYAGTTRSWGLDPLADQQLAGVIMWVPAGLAYVAAGLILLIAWIRESDKEDLLLAPSSSSDAA